MAGLVRRGTDSRGQFWQSVAVEASKGSAVEEWQVVFCCGRQDTQGRERGVFRQSRLGMSGRVWIRFVQFRQDMAFMVSQGW